MGPRDLFQLLNKDFKDKLNRNIYSQLTIGVDVSIYSYQMLRGCEGLAHDFHLVPSVDISHYVKAYWTRFIRFLGCKLIFVIDGIRNRLKSEENSDREDERRKSYDKMTDLLRSGKRARKILERRSLQ